jgi:hypothetical protein
MSESFPYTLDHYERWRQHMNEPLTDEVRHTLLIRFTVMLDDIIFKWMETHQDWMELAAAWERGLGTLHDRALDKVLPHGGAYLAHYPPREREVVEHLEAAAQQTLDYIRHREERERREETSQLDGRTSAAGSPKARAPKATEKTQLAKRKKAPVQQRLKKRPSPQERKSSR